MGNQLCPLVAMILTSQICFSYNFFLLIVFISGHRFQEMFKVTYINI